MKTGFIGLGKMGAGMASRLCQAGYELIVYNRSAERLQPLIAAGAKAAKNIAEVCDADVVFTMLANDAALSEVALGPSGILEHLKPGAIHVSCSTVSVALSTQLADAHSEKPDAFRCRCQRETRRFGRARCRWEAGHSPATPNSQPRRRTFGM